MIIRAVLTVVGILGGLLCYFVCQGMFAGYPRYHTGTLSLVGMLLIAGTGGVAWLVDESRIRDDD
ncbi:hypothetical protein WEI85_16825 [Actinomycetes bacterium KLBMP 9797]